MKFEYKKNMESNDLTRPFIITMKKLDKIEETIKICNSIDDGELVEQLKGKQVRLVYRLTYGYKQYHGIEAKHDLETIVNAGCLIHFICQENITSIEEQLLR